MSDSIKIVKNTSDGSDNKTQSKKSKHLDDIENDIDQEIEKVEKYVAERRDSIKRGARRAKRAFYL